MLVAAAAEGLVAGTGEDDHANVGPLAADAHGVEHFHVGEGAEGVVDLRAIDGDAGYPLEVIEEDVGIVFDFGPVVHGIRIFGRGMYGARRRSLRQE